METICPAYHIEPLKIELASPRFRLDSKLDLKGFIPSLYENVPPPDPFPLSSSSSPSSPTYLAKKNKSAMK